MSKPNPLRPKHYGVKDLCRITGLDEDTVRYAIRTGELPGTCVTTESGSRVYRITATAFEAFDRGEWVPNPRPLFPEPVRALPQPEDFVKARKAG